MTCTRSEVEKQADVAPGLNVFGENKGMCCVLLSVLKNK